VPSRNRNSVGTNLCLHLDSTDGNLKEVETLFGPARVLTDEEDYRWLTERVEELAPDDWIALDLEAWSPASLRAGSHTYFSSAEVVITALAREPQWRAVIQHSRSHIPHVQWYELLSKRCLCVYNAGYDIRLIWRYLGRLPERFVDALVLAGLLASGRILGAERATDDDQITGLSLADTVALYFRVPVEKSVRSEFGVSRGLLLTEQQLVYAAEDASFTDLLYHRLLQQCHREGVETIAALEHGLTPYLLRMSLHGIPIDVERLEAYADEITGMIQQAREELLDLMEQDVWTAVGPPQMDFESQPAQLDLAPLQPFLRSTSQRRHRSSPLRDGMRDGSGHDTAAVSAAAITVNRTFLPQPQVRLGTLIRAIRSGKDFTAVLYKLPNRPEQTMRKLPSQYVDLDSPRWMTAYLSWLTGGLVDSSHAKQVTLFANAVDLGLLPVLDRLPTIRLAARIVRALLRYRQLTKLYTAFIQPWLEDHLDRRPSSSDGIQRRPRIYTQYIQTRAKSGRIVSHNPNMQNVANPRQFEDGQSIDLRGIVRADPGCVLVTADYSQYELRVVAERSRERRMIEIFQREAEVRARYEQYLRERGILPWHADRVEEALQSDRKLQELKRALESVDLHRWVASLILNKSPDEVTSDERKKAKAVAFGVLYGMGPQSLAMQLRLSGQPATVEEAEEIMRSYFSTFPQLEQYMRWVHSEQVQNQWVASLIGRKRWSLPVDPLLQPPDRPATAALHRTFEIRTAAENREVFNHTIQSCNADAIKIAIILLYRRILEESTWDDRTDHPILTVHDELVVSVREPLADEMAQVVLDCMVEASRLAGMRQVPTQVGVTVASVWNK